MNIFGFGQSERKRFKRGPFIGLFPFYLVYCECL